MTREKVILMGAGVLFLFAMAGLGMSFKDNPTSPTSPIQISPYPIKPATPPHVGGQRTLHGTYICLPHKDTKGPQTMECAFGIQADDGYNYALSMGDHASQFQSGGSVTVKGLVVPLEAISSDQWYKYDIKGIMQVETLLGR